MKRRSVLGITDILSTFLYHKLLESKRQAFEKAQIRLWPLPFCKAEAAFDLQIRARTFLARKIGADVADMDVPVIGGHAGKTILPLFSLATPQPSSPLSAEDVDALTKRTQDGGTEVVQAKAGKVAFTPGVLDACKILKNGIQFQLRLPNIVVPGYMLLAIAI